MWPDIAMIENFKVYVKTFPKAGMEINDELPPEYVGLTKEDYLYFKAPLKVHAAIKKVENLFFSEVDVEGRFTSFCYRSLETVERDWKIHFQLETPFEPNVEFIDLAEEIRQEIILGLPMRVLSDKEMAKEKSAKKIIEEPVEKPINDERPPNTYRPFENL